MRRVALCSFFFALVVPVAASASKIAWMLDGVTFDDGGTATGYFVFDADHNHIVDFAASVDGGNESQLAAYTYTADDANPSRPTIDANPIATIEFTSTDDSIGNPPSYRQLRMTPVENLTDAGGTVGIDLTASLSVECYNCLRARNIASGTLVSDTLFTDGFDGN